MSNATGGYYPMLDGMRALAVSTVLIGHLVPVQWLQKLVAYGDIGVVAFFVLSGYLITGILLRLRDETGVSLISKVRGFFIRRSLRIFPIYYITLLALLGWGYQPVCDNAFRLLTYSLNIPGLPPAQALGQASHFWSLHVEEQFYLVWPFIVLLSSSRLLHGLLLLCISGGLMFKMLGPILQLPFNPFRPLLGCIDSLGLGALLAFYQYTDSYRQRFLPFLLTISSLSMPAFLLLTIIRFVLNIDPWYGSNYYLGIAMFLALGLSSVALLQYSTGGGQDGWFARLLINPLMRYIGSISYGIYVYHFFAPLVVRRLPLAVVPFGSGYILVRTLLELGFSVGVAALSFRIIERPILAFKNRIAPSGSTKMRGVIAA
ncbi:MAG: acyltransferase [Verrucomicrobia bacterium]|nr:acyltransferase [Verrucomicrobiota bacterium]